MNASTLELSLAPSGRPVPARGVVWSDVASQSHFRTNLDVELTGFGTSLTANRDFVRLGVATILADKAYRRPRSWKRSLKIIVPMEDPDPWKPWLSQLQSTLGFLTDDSWQIELVHTDLDPPTNSSQPTLADHYMLLSGGADSLSGALILGSADRTCFVSHTDAGQHAAKSELHQLWGTRVRSLTRHVQLHQDKTKGPVTAEATSRSRSLLFFGLGLLAASVDQNPLLVPENGFASLNVPLTPERTGSHSTRTTHPRYMADLREILGRVGAHNNLANPFAEITKGEMFREVAGKWGHVGASKILRVSISCAKRAGLRVPKPPGTNHCGLCYGCLVRRGAFRAAGLADETLYYADPTDSIGTPGRWHTQRQRADVAAFQYAIAEANTQGGLRDIRASLHSTRLPTGTSYADAVDLVKRGLDEVAAILP